MYSGRNYNRSCVPCRKQKKKYRYILQLIHQWKERKWKSPSACIRATFIIGTSTRSCIRSFYRLSHSHSEHEPHPTSPKRLVPSVLLCHPRRKFVILPLHLFVDFQTILEPACSFIGSEMLTLYSLWRYCKQNIGSKVIYLHSKGSFHPKRSNDLLRNLATRAALSKECSSIPSSCNVCSSRFSPFPHPHSPGNMWLSR